MYPTSSPKYLKFTLLCVYVIPLLMATIGFAQAKKTATAPKQIKKSANPIVPVPGIKTFPVDTIPSLDSLIKLKENCSCVKTLADDGCILLKYKDGFIKKICDSTVTEIITPEHRKFVLKQFPFHTFMYVKKLPSPPNPSPQTPVFIWLSSYNQQLLDEITSLLSKSPSSKTLYLNNEAKICLGNLYDQIQYRTIFIETFLKAK